MPEEKEINPIEERVVRMEKLRTVRAGGIDPYPSTSARTHEVAALLADFDRIAEAKDPVTVCGRLKSVRGHGGACFADLEDGSGKIQLHLKVDVLGANAYEFFEQRVDHGDFLQVTGTAFTTKRGERSVEATAIVLLAKALRPLPDKRHGLADVEIRYRKRYLDLIANPEVRGIFRKRSLIVQTIREFFTEGGFMEVETPVLQTIAGGASARPFVTHHHALDINLFLRVAPELHLKRLIVGGFERVFELGRSFRNEGIDHAHNPEFTSIEAYQAYADYREHMEMTERLMARLMEKVNGGASTIETDGMTVDLAGPYPRLTFRDAILQHAGIDIEQYPDRASLAKAAEGKGVKVESADDRGAILDNLYKKTVRPNLVAPTFLIDHPVEILPLAKRKASDPRYVESFQLIMAKGEYVKAFSELNDPIDQRERFMEQERLREGGDEEAQPLDEDFIEALETGMPPTAGWAIGIDRLAALLTGSHSLKEVILFPTMRPEQEEQK